MALRPGSMVLDIGCGRGRHCLLAALAGHLAVGVDIDTSRLSELGETARSIGVPTLAQRVLPDGRRALPFRDRSFDLVVVVHFVAAGLIGRAAASLRDGGYLLLETFGGHGENWRDLPAAGAMREELEPHFALIDYRERPVGPTKSEAVSVRFLARRR